MNWKVGLDRYLTASPDYGYEAWYEAVTDAFTDSFFNDNEYWCLDNNGLCNTWMDKLSRKIEEPKVAAVIIERAFKLYKNKPPMPRPTPQRIARLKTALHGMTTSVKSELQPKGIYPSLVDSVLSGRVVKWDERHDLIIKACEARVKREGITIKD